MLENFKFFFVEGFGLFSPLDWVVFGGCFTVFVLVYFLTCLLRNVRFFIPQILKFLAFCIFIGSPLGVYYLNQEVLYKHQVHYKFIKQFEYSPTFFVDGEIENIGSREIGKCYFVIKILRDESRMIDRVLNYLKPLKILTYPIDKKIAVGEREPFNHTFNDFNYPIYQTQVFCYGGRYK